MADLNSRRPTRRRPRYPGSLPRRRRSRPRPTSGRRPTRRCAAYNTARAQQETAAAQWTQKLDAVFLGSIPPMKAIHGQPDPTEPPPSVPSSPTGPSLPPTGPRTPGNPDSRHARPDRPPGPGRARPEGPEGPGQGPRQGPGQARPGRPGGPGEAGPGRPGEARPGRPAAAAQPDHHPDLPDPPRAGRDEHGRGLVAERRHLQPLGGPGSGRPDHGRIGRRHERRRDGRRRCRRRCQRHGRRHPGRRNPGSGRQLTRPSDRRDRPQWQRGRAVASRQRLRLVRRARWHGRQPRRPRCGLGRCPRCGLGRCPRCRLGRRPWCGLGRRSWSRLGRWSRRRIRHRVAVRWTRIDRCPRRRRRRQRSRRPQGRRRPGRRARQPGLRAGLAR